MPKKSKTSVIKPTMCTSCDAPLQYDIPKGIADDKKVDQREVFGKSKSKSKKVPKGSHRMKDGTIMKDKDMPKGKKKVKKY
tara:strand:+ start:944 stop:1186 length:243 start_codon:yes stop_codon:yes gene_type:complete